MGSDCRRAGKREVGLKPQRFNQRFPRLPVGLRLTASAFWGTPPLPGPGFSVPGFISRVWGLGCQILRCQLCTSIWPLNLCKLLFTLYQTLKFASILRGVGRLSLFSSLSSPLSPSSLSLSLVWWGTGLSRFHLTSFSLSLCLYLFLLITIFSSVGHWIIQVSPWLIPSIN